MRKLAIGMWCAQVAAALTLLLAALIYTQLILVPGPVLALVGCTLALVARPLRSPLVFSFALSAPVVTSLISLMIAVFRLLPDEAHSPVAALLAVYIIVSAPAAYLSLRRIRDWTATDSPPASHGLQFSVRSALLLMTVACLFLGIVSVVDLPRNSDRLVFGGYTFLVWTLCGLVAWVQLKQADPIS